MRRWLAVLAGCSAIGPYPAAAMDFGYMRIDATNGVILATGEIKSGDDERLHRYVGSLSAGTVLTAIALSSPGGNYVEGVNLATTIRSSGLATLVTAGSTCASACFLMFASGQQKFVGPGARIGVHSASVGGEDNGVAQAVTTLMARKAAELGVPSGVIGKMVTTPPDQIAWLTGSDLHEMRAEMVVADNDTYTPGSALTPGQRPTASPVASDLPSVSGSPSATMPNQALSPALSSPSPAFLQGRSDRTAYQQWFDQQPESDYRSGALWWATNRTQAARLHLTCTTVSTTPAFVQGCMNAQRFLVPSDRRRATEPDYKNGWNSL